MFASDLAMTPSEESMIIGNEAGSDESFDETEMDSTNPGAIAVRSNGDEVDRSLHEFTESMMIDCGHHHDEERSARVSRLVLWWKHKLLMKSSQRC